MITRRDFLVGATAISVTPLIPGVTDAASAQNMTDVTAAELRRRKNLETFLKVFPPSSSPKSGRINAHDKNWEDWLRRTGELPPDFEMMESIPGLPDPLLLIENGGKTRVTTEVLWNRQRAWIRSQMEQWVFGRMPPAPDNLRGIVTGRRREGTTTVQEVRLEFGPDHRAILHIQLIIPDGAGPFPVFLTDHNRRLSWLYTAVRRGYIGCFYAASDPVMGGGSDDSDGYIEVYPEYDFSCLARWAWSASRAVDYLVTLPEVDKGKIGLAGHSRYGKQALLAAAFDDRIAAVIPSSGNTGECDPWRYTTDMFVNESLEKITADFPHWFHPRLRLFAGREDKLPVDQNMLAALVAPRGLMMYSGYGESEGNPFGYEQAYRSVERVYELLGHKENLWLDLRDGEHPPAVADAEKFIDFLDTVFGRKQFPRRENFLLGYTFEGWQKLSGITIDPLSYPRQPAGAFLNDKEGHPIVSASQWADQKKAILQKISALLGEAPPRVPFESPTNFSQGGLKPYYYTEGWLSLVYKRPFNDESVQPQYMGEGLGVAGVPFGDGLTGELFYPATEGGKPRSNNLPVVIWLHPYSYQNGWSAYRPWMESEWAYARDFRPSFRQLVKRGFAVFAFDQVGFGARIHEERNFYQRYPRWSTLGNMLADTRSAIDGLANLVEIDATRIFLLGYALGGKVGLLTAAFDDRIKGLVSVCGFDPLRLDTAASGTEGIRQYSHLHGLLPSLGYFVGQEDRVPFDFDEILATVAPKPAMVVAPTLDRYARIADVRREVEASQKIYALLGHPEALTFETPLDINRFAHATQESAVEWLVRQ